MSTLFRSYKGIIEVNTFECGCCHDPDGLRGSAYKYEIEGKLLAICGRCFLIKTRENLKLEGELYNG